jgi:NRPS condensation-like uncharacterized protein
LEVIDVANRTAAEMREISTIGNILTRHTSLVDGDYENIATILPTVAHPDDGTLIVENHTIPELIANPFLPGNIALINQLIAAHDNTINDISIFNNLPPDFINIIHNNMVELK